MSPTTQESPSGGWRGQLTDVLLGYIQRHSITRIIECIADERYRMLLDWKRVRRAVDNSVLQGLSGQHRGPAMLPSLGAALRLLLADPDRLANIKAGDTVPVPDDGVRFEPLRQIPSTLPSTARRPCDVITQVDMMGRMRGNIITILNTLYGPADPNICLGDRINLLVERDKLDGDIAGHMQRFLRQRSPVEYGGDATQGGRVMTETIWRILVSDYQMVSGWAHNTRGLDATALGPV